RHVFVVFASPLPWRELRDVARALAVRFPAIDTAPMASLGGQIAPPGSRHKSGGWRLLSMPGTPGCNTGAYQSRSQDGSVTAACSSARSAVEPPNGPQVWAALLTELAAELRHVELVGEVGAVGS